ncbi:unnamed protein product [Amoebophrya sp. A120]|nr:unnamed protein product [Amoebophrya sp. A120]|eukprot:GSA120T00002055001.1
MATSADGPARNEQGSHPVRLPPVQLELFLAEDGESRVVSHAELVENGLLWSKRTQASRVGYHPTPDEGAYIHVARLKEYLFQTLGGEREDAKTADEIPRTLDEIRKRDPRRIQMTRVGVPLETTGLNKTQFLPPIAKSTTRGSPPGSGSASPSGRTTSVLRRGYDDRFAASAVTAASYLQVESVNFPGKKWIPSARFLDLRFHPATHFRDLGKEFHLSIPVADREFLFIPQLRPKTMKVVDFSDVPADTLPPAEQPGQHGDATLPSGQEVRFRFSLKRKGLSRDAVRKLVSRDDSFPVVLPEVYDVFSDDDESDMERERKAVIEANPGAFSPKRSSGRGSVLSRRPTRLGWRDVETQRRVVCFREPWRATLEKLLHSMLGFSSRKEDETKQMKKDLDKAFQEAKEQKRGSSSTPVDHESTGGAERTSGELSPADRLLYAYYGGEPGATNAESLAAAGLVRKKDNTEEDPNVPKRTMTQAEKQALAKARKRFSIPSQKLGPNFGTFEELRFTMQELFDMFAQPEVFEKDGKESLEALLLGVPKPDAAVHEGKDVETVLFDFNPLRLKPLQKQLCLRAPGGNESLPLAMRKTKKKEQSSVDPPTLDPTLVAGLGEGTSPDSSPAAKKTGEKKRYRFEFGSGSKAEISDDRTVTLTSDLTATLQKQGLLPDDKAKVLEMYERCLVPFFHLLCENGPADLLEELVRLWDKKELHVLERYVLPDEGAPRPAYAALSYVEQQARAQLRGAQWRENAGDQREALGEEENTGAPSSSGGPFQQHLDDNDPRKAPPPSGNIKAATAAGSKKKYSPKKVVGFRCVDDSPVVPVGAGSKNIKGHKKEGTSSSGGRNESNADPTILSNKKRQVTTPFLSTPLHAAAKGNRTDIAEMLLQCEKDALERDAYFRHFLPDILQETTMLHAKDEKGWTPLLCAAARGQISMVRWLLEQKADVNTRGAVRGETPLFLATASGNTELVQELLRLDEHRYRWNHAGENEVTAVGGDVAERTTALVEKNSDPASILDQHVQQQLDALLKTSGSAGTTGGDFQTKVPLFQEYLNFNTKLYDNMETPLTRACWEGDLEIAKILLDTLKDETRYGMSQRILHINSKDGLDRTPLLHAILGKKPLDMVRLLLEYRYWANFNVHKKKKKLHYKEKPVVHLSPMQRRKMMEKKDGHFSMDIPLLLPDNSALASTRPRVGLIKENNVESWFLPSWYAGPVETIGPSPKKKTRSLSPVRSRSTLLDLMGRKDTTQLLHEKRPKYGEDFYLYPDPNDNKNFRTAADAHAVVANAKDLRVEGLESDDDLDLVPDAVVKSRLPETQVLDLNATLLPSKKTALHLSVGFAENIGLAEKLVRQLLLADLTHQRLVSTRKVSRRAGHAFLDVNARDGTGETVLYQAVDMKQISLVRLLLSHNAIDVNAHVFVSCDDRHDHTAIPAEDGDAKERKKETEDEGMNSPKQASEVNSPTSVPASSTSSPQSVASKTPSPPKSPKGFSSPKAGAKASASSGKSKKSTGVSASCKAKPKAASPKAAAAAEATAKVAVEKKVVAKPKRKTASDGKSPLLRAVELRHVVMVRAFLDWDRALRASDFFLPEDLAEIATAAEAQEAQDVILSAAMKAEAQRKAEKSTLYALGEGDFLREVAARLQKEEDRAEKNKAASSSTASSKKGTPRGSSIKAEKSAASKKASAKNTPRGKNKGTATANKTGEDNKANKQPKSKATSGNASPKETGTPQHGAILQEPTEPLDATSPIPFLLNEPAGTNADGSSKTSPPVTSSPKSGNKKAGKQLVLDYADKPLPKLPFYDEEPVLQWKIRGWDAEIDHIFRLAVVVDKKIQIRSKRLKVNQNIDYATVKVLRIDDPDGQGYKKETAEGNWRPTASGEGVRVFVEMEGIRDTKKFLICRYQVKEVYDAEMVKRQRIKKYLLARADQRKAKDVGKKIGQKILAEVLFGDQNYNNSLSLQAGRCNHKDDDVLGTTGRAVGVDPDEPVSPKNEYLKSLGAKYSDDPDAKTLLGVDVMSVDPFSLHQQNMSFAWSTSTGAVEAPAGGRGNNGMSSARTKKKSGNVNKTEVTKSKPLNPNIQDRVTGKTPLHIAVETQHIDMIRLLLTHPFCNPHVPDLLGRTPSILATTLPVGMEKDRILKLFENMQRDDHG